MHFSIPQCFCQQLNVSVRHSVSIGQLNSYHRTAHLCFVLHTSLANYSAVEPMRLHLLCPRPLLIYLIAICAQFLWVAVASIQAAEKRPTSVLFVIADDASRHFGGAYQCDWVRTPNIERLARNGLVFTNAYTPTAKCAPSRSAILTGRNPWQLEEAANHQPYFPAKYKTFSEALKEKGIAVGGQGKIWGPVKPKRRAARIATLALKRRIAIHRRRLYRLS